MLPTCLWSTADAPPAKLDELAIDESVGNQGHLSGGSGGIYVFKTTDSKRYTLKRSSSHTALKDEVFADAVYQQLGFNVPPCSLFQASYHELPATIQAVIPKPDDETEIIGFRLADYIEPNLALSEEDKRQIIKDQLPLGFVTDCFLANTDIAGHWQNVLIDKNNKIWRIDNGSTLRFRARGEMKNLRTVVGELSSMKNETEMMRAVFGDISPAEIQEQVDVLLKNRHILIELFLEMQKRIGFDQPEMLLKILVNRLQYLHEHVNQELYLYAPALSEACLDYSGAGIFLWANLDSKKQVLLGKRVGHDWWGSFGGATDEKDWFLRDTAARESNEELMGLYTIQAGELDKLPSHDLIMEEPFDLYVPKFRLYFVERKPIEAREFNEKIKRDQLQNIHHEHDEFVWVPIDAILNAKTVLHSDPKYGSHQTLAINILQEDGSTRSIDLHPPLAQMLQQGPVRAQLECLVNGKNLDNHHTRTRVSKTYPATITEDVTKADEVTPMSERTQLANTTVQRSLMHRELFQHFQEGNENLPPANGKIQSDIHFQAIMGDQFQAQDTHQKKVAIFDKSYKRIQVAMGDGEQRQFSKMLEEESRHPNHCVFYHAGSAEIAFIYDVFTEFRRQLEHQYSGDFMVLRALDDLFAQFKDVTEFMAAHIAGGSIYNYTKDYQEMGLSVNPFLFGSDGNTGSASYYYFLKSQSSVPPDIEKLFHYFVSRLQIGIDFSLFHSIFKQFREKAGGVCYQIFVDHAYVDQVAYPAQPGGGLNPLITEQDEIKIFSKVLEELQRNPRGHVEYIQDLQARLYLKPEIFHNLTQVQIKTYSAQPLSTEENKDYQDALSSAVGYCVTQLLAHYKKLPDHAFSSGKPSLHRQMGEVYQRASRLPVSEVSDAKILLPDMIAQGNVVSLIDLLVHATDLDPSQPLISRNYMSRGTPKTVTLQEIFYNHSHVARQVFAGLEKSHQEKPHIPILLNLLKPVVIYDMIEQGSALSDLINIMIDTKDLDLSKSFYISNYMQGVMRSIPTFTFNLLDFLNKHIDIAREVFFGLQPYSAQPPIHLALSQLKQIIMLDMISKKQVSELIELLNDAHGIDLDLDQDFHIFDFGIQRKLRHTLFYFFKEHLDVAEAVFNGLKKSFQVAQETTKIVTQLQILAWYYHVSNGNLDQVKALFEETHPDKRDHLFTAIRDASIHAKENVLDWLLDQCTKYHYDLPDWIISAENTIYGGIGQSALVMAITNGHPKIVEKFLSVVAAPTLTDLYFDDLLSLAITHDRLDVVAVILEKLLTMPKEVYENVLIDRNNLRYGRESVLCYLATKGEASILEKILTVGSIGELADSVRSNKEHENLLTIATKNRHADVVRALLKFSKTNNSICADNLLLLATKQNDVAIVQLLLPHVHNFYDRDEVGKTSLMVAAENGNNDIITVFLNSKAICTSKYYLTRRTVSDQLDAFSLAVRNGHTDSVRILLTPQESNSLIPGVWDFRAALQLSHQLGYTEIFKLVVSSTACPITVLDLLIEIDDAENIKRFSQRITAIDDFNKVMKAAKPENKEKIFKLFENLLPGMIKDQHDFYIMIDCLTVKQCAAVCLRRIKTAGDFNFAMISADSEKRTEIYQALKHELSSMIKERLDYYYVLQYLTPEQSAEICLKTITTVNDFNNAMHHVSEEQRVKIYEVLKNTLPDMMNENKDYFYVFRFLTPEHSAELGHKTITTLDHFINAMQYTDRKHRTKIYEAVKETLPEISKGREDFFNVVITYLTSEQYAEVCSKRIKTANDFRSAMGYADEEQRTKIYEQLKNKLPEMARGDTDFFIILEYLTPKQCTEFSAKVIRTADDFNKFKSQCSHFFWNTEKINAVTKAYQLNQLSNAGSISNDFGIGKIRSYFWKPDNKDPQEKQILKIYEELLRKLNEFLISEPGEATDQQLDLYKLAKTLKLVIQEFANSKNITIFSIELEVISTDLKNRERHQTLLPYDRAFFIKIIEEIDQTRQEILEFATPAKMRSAALGCAKH
ncbi:MAG: hypothetical protein A3F17_06635 [Gammaproteobacteria bacterium RIFCSPHIGHO2_12_FULL_41_15]|nr:MAG: hypothetical protein A3F17_06635 [Gammaproteobacteria bacterium RIFCSPHIGHO2_12_FULL_41_15]